MSFALYKVVAYPPKSPLWKGDFEYLKPTNNQQPTTNNQQPTTNNQQPTTNNQLPTTNNQQPTTNNKQPTTNYQSSLCLILAVSQSSSTGSTPSTSSYCHSCSNSSSCSPFKGIIAREIASETKDLTNSSFLLN